jgi:hypothetical protein
MKLERLTTMKLIKFLWTKTLSYKNVKISMRLKNKTLITKLLRSMPREKMTTESLKTLVILRLTKRK